MQSKVIYIKTFQLFKKRFRCHTRKSERYNVIGNWTYTPGPINCEVVEAVCADGKKDVYGFLHTQVIAT